MARTKPAKAAAKKAPAKGAAPAPPAPIAPIKKNAGSMISMRGSLQWRDWLSRFAVRSRLTPTTLIDLALTEKAARDGFEVPPPRY